MSATVIEVRDWIYDKIRTLIDGTGDYTYDLTAAGQVIRADASAPWMVDGSPCASVFFVRSVTGTEPTLCKFDRQMTFGVVGFSSTTASVTDTAANVFNAMMTGVLVKIAIYRVLISLCRALTASRHASHHASYHETRLHIPAGMRCAPFARSAHRPARHLTRQSVTDAG